MFKKRHWKPALLAGLLLLGLLGVSGCLNKPDNIDPLPEETGNVLPFVTSSPSPSPAPSDAQTGEDGGEGWEDFTSSEPVVVVTNAPTPLPTIALITASPTPSSEAWTYSPAPTASPTAKPTDDGTLRSGSTGTAVRNLQQRLKDLKFYTGSVDGDFGPATETALKAFQKANGLTADGIAGSKTLAAINSSSAKANTTTNPGTYATSRPTPQSYTPSTPGKYGYLQLGSSGAAVTKLQNRLKELGYFHGTVNGKFGDDTEAAVRAFQERNGEWVDGVAGEDTQTRLFGPDALPARSNSGSVPSTGYRTLASGDKGDDVSLLQTRLQTLGYYTGAIDGSFGPSTATAVKLFQQFNGLSDSGEADTGTLARVYSANALYAPTTDVATARTAASIQTLELGSMGEEVYSLQERLYDLGYYTDRIDGIYSDAVVSSVRAFQMANNLTADGKAGRSTQTKLYSGNAIPAASVDDTYVTLRQGDTGERVRALQSMLLSLGYYAGEVSGTYDLATVLAVQQLQVLHGLTSDGVAGPATLQLLYQGTPQRAVAESPASQIEVNYATLRQGSSGPDVTMLQQFLSELGYYDGAQSGAFDAATLIAVQEFQSRNGLTADGVAGGETLALLYSGQGVPSETFAQTLYGDLLAPAPTRETLREGDEGQDVFTMQERLYILGYLAGAPDGKYGSATVSAVRAFQQQNKLTVDGIAGKDTISAMYAANAVAAFSAAAFEVVDNSARELGEQQATGAIQGSLAGGGIAASYGSSTYYVGSGGTLYVRGSGGDRQFYNGKASFIHASDRGVTFVSGNKIMRVPAAGGAAETLATVGGIQKLAVIGESLLYLDGTTLMRARSSGDAVALATGVSDFVLDVYQDAVYTASATGVRRMGVNGSGEQLLVSTKADQVQIADSVVFFRSGGTLYRMQDGVSRVFLEANATWMGIYRDQVYYISGGKLYRCGTDGQNNSLFYDGQTADVSFVAGRVYIAERNGGEVKEIIDVGASAP